jgi:hypothetical protein
MGRLKFILHVAEKYLKRSETMIGRAYGNSLMYMDFENTEGLRG